MPPKIALEDNIGTTKPKCWFRFIVLYRTSLLLQLKNEAHGRYLKRWIDLSASFDCGEDHDGRRTGRTG